MKNLQEFNYKRGVITYIIDGIEYTDKVLNVYLNNKFVCYIAKCEVNLDYYAYKDTESDYFCGGQTLKECKEILSLNYFKTESNWHNTSTKLFYKKTNNTTINLTTSEKKEIICQLIINRVKNNKCILKFVGADLNGFNYAEIVALMLVSKQNLSTPIIELLSPNNPFSKKVRAIQYS
tara:strand:- start:2062 stop:2595 length:534 start_codon:yes stop_codon:yes gene_type:complete